MPRKLYSLTPEHRAQLKPWAEKWIQNAMSTKPMDDADRAAMIKAIHGMYDAAKLPRPKHVVFVPSPFVLRFASGFAAWIWYKHHKLGKAKTDAATSAATSAATRDATDAATYAATDDATDAATRAATRDATSAVTRDATAAATSAATSAATRDATDAATRDATAAATDAATYAATSAATSAVTEDATSAATSAATYDATRAATYDATRAVTYAATYAATRDATYDATREDTYADPDNDDWYRCQRMQIVSWVKRIAGRETKKWLRCIQSYNLWHGGNQWSAWAAYLSFFRHVAKLNLKEYDAFKHWESAAIHGGPRAMHADFCMVSDRPERLLVDSENLPHCDDGPFCRWRDGAALYAIHGVRVPAWLVENPERLTVQRIDKEQNAEVRRVMISRYGAARYIQDSGAKMVHQDDFGALYRKPRTDDTDLVVVKVVNSTPEPDGSFKDYWLRVPPEMRTAREAVAWTFGKSEAEYAPEIET